MDNVTIVAEAAQGFEGNPTIAVLLVRAAAAAKADVVKFQLVYADELAAPHYEYFGLFKSLEMPDAAWRAVADEAVKHGLKLAFDIFGLRSLNLAMKLGSAAVKLHVSDFFNEPLFDAAVRSSPQVYFSVGGISAQEVRAGLARYDDTALSKLTMMVGFQAEPTKLADNHIRRLETWRQRHPNMRLGFMDHADGDSDEAGWLGALAVAYSISVVEKHITIERTLRLEDYTSAATPSEFANYVSRIRSAEIAYGSAQLDLTEPEIQYRRRALKALVATRDLPSGARIAVEDLRPLRTPLVDGREPTRHFTEAVGRKLVRSIRQYEAVYKEDVE